jgi:hypothetical protein
MVEASNSDFQGLGGDGGSGQHGMDLPTPRTILILGERDEKAARVNEPPQDHFAFGGGGFGEEFG